MNDANRFSPPTRQWFETGQGQFTLRMAGRLDVNTASAAFRAILQELKKRSPQFLSINIEDIDYFDDFGAVVLFDLKKQVTDQKGNAEIVGASEAIQSIIDQTVSKLSLCDAKQTIRFDNFPERLGGSTIKFG